jgi:hypothetical protein
MHFRQSCIIISAFVAVLACFFWFSSFNRQSIQSTQFSPRPRPFSHSSSPDTHTESDQTMATKAVAETMRAIVIHEKGGPEMLKYYNNYPRPVPKSGEVLIRVKAFGLNRAEMFTRQGHSPGVTFPLVLGIEATGVVEEAPTSEFANGQVVVTAMG